MELIKRNRITGHGIGMKWNSSKRNRITGHGTGHKNNAKEVIRVHPTKNMVNHRLQ